MSIIGLINIVIVNIIAWVALSYFWSFWTHRLFKPWLWLELHKRKLIAASVERGERRFKDRARYYSIFFAMEQVERAEVAGSFVMAGLEEAEIINLLRAQCPEREIWAIGPMEATSATLTHENCQGQVTEESVSVDFAAEADVRRLMPEGPKNHLLKGGVAYGVAQVSGPVALGLVDCVEYEGVLASLQAIYPLLPPGGVVIIHSYNHSWGGVRSAVDRFLAGVPEGMVPLPDMYGSVAIVKNKQQAAKS